MSVVWIHKHSYNSVHKLHLGSKTKLDQVVFAQASVVLDIFTLRRSIPSLVLHKVMRKNLKDHGQNMSNMATHLWTFVITTVEKTFWKNTATMRTNAQLHLIQKSDKPNSREEKRVSWLASDSLSHMSYVSRASLNGVYVFPTNVYPDQLDKAIDLLDRQDERGSMR